MLAEAGENFFDALKNLITRKGIFSSQGMDESFICQYFLDKYPGIKIAEFSELKSTLENITSSQAKNLQYQIEAMDFIIENMCERNVIRNEEKFKTIIGLLSDKFKNAKENLYLVPVILTKCVNLIDVKTLNEKERDIDTMLSNTCKGLISQQNFNNECEYILKKHMNYQSNIFHILKDNRDLYNKMLGTMYAWIVAEKLNDKDRITKLMKDEKFLYYYDTNWDCDVKLFDLAHLKYLWEYCDMNSEELCKIFRNYDIAEDICCWGIMYLDSVHENMVNSLLEKGEIKINQRLFKILASKKIIGIKQEIIYFAKLYFVQLKEEDKEKIDKLWYIQKQLSKITHYKNIDIGRFKSFCEGNKEKIIKCKTGSEKNNLMKEMVDYINNHQNNLQAGQSQVPNRVQINIVPLMEDNDDYYLFH